MYTATRNSANAEIAASVTGNEALSSFAPRSAAPCALPAFPAISAAAIAAVAVRIL